MVAKSTLSTSLGPEQAVRHKKWRKEGTGLGTFNVQRLSLSTVVVG